ncbi:ribosomal protein S16 [Iris pallida]|uniref:Ribosomal protein S16 (Chloroplast) n=1 Tax=Iris pallida TaxID=29817 RepID=A0AAX6G710_IRIPA|nr:ribosomal protein S16 [Iris pallida]
MSRKFLYNIDSHTSSSIKVYFILYEVKKIRSGSICFSYLFFLGFRSFKTNDKISIKNYVLFSFHILCGIEIRPLFSLDFLWEKE